MATITFKDVNKIYSNHVQAVFDFALEVKDKEFVVFVGPSGSGKTTVLRMIAGFEDVTSGEILIDDRLVNHIAPKDRDIAMVFQDYALYPHLSVFDNIAFALKMRKVKVPLVEVDKKNPLYISKKAKLLADSRALISEKTKEMQAKKEPKDKIAAQKIQIETELISALKALDEEFSRPVLGVDYDLVDSLEKEIEQRKRSKNPDFNKIQELKEKRDIALRKDDVPQMEMRHLNEDEITDRVYETARILGLVPYLNRKPDALSGGQRQRVALGRAIVRHPKLFLMDEPLSSLDVKLRAQARAEILKIHKSVGATTIYVTHDQVEALTLAERIVVMKDGSIQQVGSPEEIYNKPRNMFVASFMGTPAMNFIKGTFNEKEFIVDSEEQSAFPLPESWRNKLKDYRNKEIIFGIRPEDVSLLEGATFNNPSDPFCVYVEAVELLGYEKVIYGRIGDNRLAMKVPVNEEVQIGETRKCVYDSEKAHFFDAETTMAIGE